MEAVVESGVAMEISNRYRLPHDRLLRKAQQAGARFSLGSDGHTARQIAPAGLGGGDGAPGRHRRGRPLHPASERRR